jgi:tetratricopeptide (TPR) repeat protein
VPFNLTQAYFAAGQKSKALQLANSLSDREKNDVRAHFTLGILLAGQKLYSDAIHEFELADALNPGLLKFYSTSARRWSCSWRRTNSRLRISMSFFFWPE